MSKFEFAEFETTVDGDLDKIVVDLGVSALRGELTAIRVNDVVRLAAQGLTTSETGAQLFISEETAKGYRRRALADRGVATMAGAVNADIIEGKIKINYDVTANEAPSDREREVLEQVAAGLRNSEIGETLFIAEETVKSHISHLFEKLDAKNRTHLVTRGYETGQLPLPLSQLDPELVQWLYDDLT